MTDLELTRAAAEAMGYIVVDALGDLVRVKFEYRSFAYHPLNDDAQAMALVKRFRIFIEAPEPPVMLQWHAFCWIKPGREDNAYGKADDLNRAIVECVAKLTGTKPSSGP